MKYISILAAILLAIGCFNLPIGYYTFLRIVVFIVSIVIIISNIDEGLDWSNVTLGIIAIIFNPIIPIYLHEKAIWVVIDAVSAVIFSIKTYQLFKK